MLKNAALAAFALAISLSQFASPNAAMAQDAVNGSAGGARVAVGQMAKDFELDAVAGELSGQVKLSDLTSKGPVAIVVLRGFPGYQCPLCSRQVGAMMRQANQFQAKDAKVLFVYPGPAAQLKQKANEFLRGTQLPAPFTLLLDPDYEFTNAYGLRWNAPRETAYPAALVIGTDGKVTFANISSTHAGRTDGATILKQL